MINLECIYKLDDKSNEDISELSLEINQGDFISISGDKQSSVITLINIIGLLENPSRGNYYFNNQLISDKPLKYITKTRVENFGFIFKEPLLIDYLSIYDNMVLILKSAGKRTICQKDFIYNIASKFKINYLLNKFPNKLSFKEQQIVMLSRAMLLEPEVLIVYDPTNEMDSSDKDEFMKLLVQLNNDGLTIIFGCYNYIPVQIPKSYYISKGIIKQNLCEI